MMACLAGAARHARTGCEGCVARALPLGHQLIARIHAGCL
jgi:hypothetical protein